MRSVTWIVAIGVVLAAGMGNARAQDAGRKFGDAAFLRYEGAQSWPQGSGAQIISEFAVPIYLGLPARPYKVLGRIYDTRTSGIGVMTRAFAEGLFPERDRQRDCAEQAKYQGGDAVLVTNDPRIIKAFGLSAEDLSKTTPLFQHKDSVTLAIKLE